MNNVLISRCVLSSIRRISTSRSFPSQIGKVVPLVDPKYQSRALPDGSRISNFLKTDELHKFVHEDAQTLYECIRRGARVSNNGPMLGSRQRQPDGSEPYVWITYNEVIKRSEDIGRGFRALGFPIGQETLIGVYSQNRPEWLMVEHAIYAFNNVLVPFSAYEFVGSDNRFFINMCRLEIIVVDSAEKAKALIYDKSNTPSLKHIILIQPTLPSDLQIRAQKSDIILHTLNDVEKLGREHAPIHNVPPRPEDLCVICFTSGTSGTTKGVMLTHGNTIACMTAVETLVYSRININDVLISYLPLAHMFERCFQSSVYSVGGRVGFYRGIKEKLMEDAQELKPTIFPAVPTVLYKIHDAVMEEVNKSAIKTYLFKLALDYKNRLLHNWIIRNDTFVDKYFFSKIRGRLGGRVKLMVTGSAPMSPEVLNFIRCVMGCVVVEGYGLTECICACTISIEGDHFLGHVGMPLPCNSVKLIDEPDFGMFAKDKVGEICVRGHNVFKGYYRNDEETRKALDSDGWLHTGDIGRWTHIGTMQIIDRKKNLFKLRNGFTVAPEKLESIYIRSKYVAQIYVYGFAYKNSLVSIVVPNFNVTRAAAEQEFKTKIKSNEELCANPRVKQLIIKDMVEVAKSNGLHDFEMIKDIHLYPEAFTVENRLITTTLKNRRPALKERFQKIIEEMFKNLD